MRRHGGGRRHGEEEEDGELGHWDPNPIGVWGDWMSVSSGCGADHIGRKCSLCICGATVTVALVRSDRNFVRPFGTDRSSDLTK